MDWSDHGLWPSDSLSVGVAIPLGHEARAAHATAARVHVPLAPAHPDVVARLERILDREHVPDPSWPQHLPNNWIIGQVGGLYVDQHDHVWVYHTPQIGRAHV